MTEEEQKLEIKLSVVSFLINKQSIEIFLSNLGQLDKNGLVAKEVPLLTEAIDLLKLTVIELDKAIASRS
jgi:hypothetical protein